MKSKIKGLGVLVMIIFLIVSILIFVYHNIEVKIEEKTSIYN